VPPGVDSLLPVQPQPSYDTRAQVYLSDLWRKRAIAARLAAAQGCAQYRPPPAGKGNLFNEVIRSSENPGLVLIETLANSTLMMRQIRHALQQLKV
jgi:hypothetical protein